MLPVPDRHEVKWIIIYLTGAIINHLDVDDDYTIAGSGRVNSSAGNFSTERVSNYVSNRDSLSDLCHLPARRWRIA